MHPFLPPSSPTARPTFCCAPSRAFLPFSLVRVAPLCVQWEAASEAAKSTQNMWIIVNDDIKGSIEHFGKWKKDNKIAGDINVRLIPEN